ncbi:MAG: amidohydrolase family protein [Rhizobiales bacterium]|nr:amidohydrolase family protein [Hyphomicrobiales bacterium]
MGYYDGKHSLAGARAGPGARLRDRRLSRRRGAARCRRDGLDRSRRRRSARRGTRRSEAAKRHAEDRRIAAAVVAHAPLDAPDLEDRLDRLVDAAPMLRSIRDIVAVRPGFPSFARRDDLLQRPAFATGLRALARRGLAFDLMLEPWQMDAALKLASAIPDLQFIVEHAGSPDWSTGEGGRLWGEAMRAAARLPNVAVKISALHCRMPQWSDRALGAAILDLASWFGVARLAFASDFPVHDRTVPFARAYESFAAAVADLSADEQRALFHDTARRLYRM